MWNKMIISLSLLAVFYIGIASLMSHCSNDVDLWGEELE